MYSAQFLAAMIEQAANRLVERQTQYEQTPAGIPFECECGRDLRDHLGDEVLALNAMISLMETGSLGEWENAVNAEGDSFPRFMVRVFVRTPRLEAIMTKAPTFVGEMLILQEVVKLVAVMRSEIQPNVSFWERI